MRCTSCFIKPEEPAPEPAEENSDHSEVKTEEDALLGAEDSEEGCENQRKGGTLQQCTRKSSASKCKNSGESDSKVPTYCDNVSHNRKVYVK